MAFALRKHVAAVLFGAAQTTTMLTEALATAPAVPSGFETGSSVVRTAKSGDVFLARPFSSKESLLRDQERIDELCENVWGGTDYVPELAKVYEADPSCEFLVLEEAPSGGDPIREASDSDASPPPDPPAPPLPLRPLVAAGNRRLLPGTADTWWIEAIRVSESFRGRGIAGLLTAELCSRCRSSGRGGSEEENDNDNIKSRKTEILSCTKDQNRAMDSVFAKPGVDLRRVPGGAAAWTPVDDLKELPGWSSSSSSEVVPQNILRSVGLEDRIPESAKNLRWEVIETYEELASALATEQSNSNGESESTTDHLGYLPWFGKVLWPCEELSDSLRRGLVRKLARGNGNDDGPAVVWALVRDPAVSTELRTRYVCSVAASRAEDLDAVLWEACRPEYAERMDTDADADLDPNPEGTHHPPVFRMVTLWPLAGTSATVEGIPLERNDVFRFYRWRAGENNNDDESDVV